MKKTISILLIAFLFIGMSCKKKAAEQGNDPRIPPDMAFKTGGLYVTKDSTFNKLDTVRVGIIVTKTEDNLTSFNASVSYDGSTSTTTFFNHQCLSSEYTSYSTDLKYVTRNQTGSEKLIFTIVDRDGNITKKYITITVI